MKQDNKSFQSLLQKFFLQWLITQRNVSPETIKSYRDAFKLFIKYLGTAHKIKPSVVTLNCLEAEYILGFLDFLEKERHNQPKTINNRFSAISCFLRFLSFEIPEYSGLLNRSLMIPFRKEEKRQMDFLTKEEYQALFDVCESESELGNRDKLMLLILYNTGVRVSELIGIKIKDIIMDAVLTTPCSPFWTRYKIIFMCSFFRRGRRHCIAHIPCAHKYIEHIIPVMCSSA